MKMKKMLLIVLSISLFAGIGQASPAPVSYWEMEETSGITAGDTMGLNPGTLELMDFSVNAVAGRAAGKQALSFSTNNDLVRIPTSTTLSSYTSMSFMCWVNVASLDGGIPVFVSSEASVSNSAGFTSLLYPGSQYAVYASDGSTPGSSGITGPALTLGQWYMLTYTSDGAQGTLYIDNNPVAGPVAQTNAPSAVDWLLGESFLFGKRAFVGAMDEAAFWNVCLSPGDVADVYANGVTVPEPITMALLGLGFLAFLRKRR
jgi:hypothetical protein